MGPRQFLTHSFKHFHSPLPRKDGFKPPRKLTFSLLIIREKKIHRFEIWRGLYVSLHSMGFQGTRLNETESTIVRQAEVIGVVIQVEKKVEPVGLWDEG